MRRLDTRHGLGRLNPRHVGAAAVVSACPVRFGADKTIYNRFARKSSRRMAGTFGDDCAEKFQTTGLEGGTSQFARRPLGTCRNFKITRADGINHGRKKFVAHRYLRPHARRTAVGNDFADDAGNLRGELRRNFRGQTFCAVEHESTDINRPDKIFVARRTFRAEILAGKSLRQNSASRKNRHESERNFQRAVEMFGGLRTRRCASSNQFGGDF